MSIKKALQIYKYSVAPSLPTHGPSFKFDYLAPPAPITTIFPIYFLAFAHANFYAHRGQLILPHMSLCHVVLSCHIVIFILTQCHIHIYISNTIVK